MRKTVLTLAFFIILSLSLSGCDEKKEEKLVLTILTEREYEDQVKVARHGFNEKYDDVEVKIQTLSEEPETRETQISEAKNTDCSRKRVRRIYFKQFTLWIRRTVG